MTVRQKEKVALPTTTQLRALGDAVTDMRAVLRNAHRGVEALRNMSAIEAERNLADAVLRDIARTLSLWDNP